MAAPQSQILIVQESSPADPSLAVVAVKENPLDQISIAHESNASVAHTTSIAAKESSIAKRHKRMHSFSEMICKSDRDLRFATFLHC